MITVKQLLEVLNDREKEQVSHWEKASPEVRSHTDHFFGKDNDDVYTPLKDTVDKSEVHKKIESYLDKDIHPDDYKEGKTTDKYGRPVRIGRLLTKHDSLKHEFENDSTRQGKNAKGLTVRTTRSPEGVAGQTSHNQSWENQSCKNFNTGSNRKYLKGEVKHGTVVSYLHDENGKEIARATHQPHINDQGHVAYAVDAHYGIKHAGFKKHCEEVSKQLSGEHKGGSLMYKKHPGVYDDSGVKEILHPNATSKDISKALDDKDPVVRLSAIKHPNATLEHISKALDDENRGVRYAAIKHPNATLEHISKALDDENRGVRHAAIEHPNATAENISKALRDEDYRVRLSAIEHPKATPEHISKALDDKDFRVRLSAIQHPKATAAHISRALDDKAPAVRYAAIKHPNATSENISKALEDKEPAVRLAAIRHPRATGEHISKALGDEDFWVRKTAIEHPKATGEHLSKALGDEDRNVRYAAIQHPRATGEHISKALGDEDFWVRKTAIEHPNATAENISKALRDEDTHVHYAAKNRLKVRD
jgi:HEAT repeat protein